MTKQQTIDTLKTQLPGFYSAEQVIELISNIEDAGSAPFDPAQFKDLILEAVEEAINSMDTGDFVDYDSAIFELDGNSILIESIDVNTDDIISNIMDNINEVFDKQFPEEEDDCEC